MADLDNPAAETSSGRPSRKIIPSSRLTDGNNGEAPLTASHRRAIAAASSALKSTNASHASASNSTTIPPSPLNPPPSTCAPQTPTPANTAPVTPLDRSGASKRASVEDNDDDIQILPPPKRTRAVQDSETSELDNSGMHVDVHVTAIFDAGNENIPTKLNKSAPTADIERFFERCAPPPTNNKPHRLCLTCKQGLSCVKETKPRVDECTSLRRHMQSLHKDIYLKWCKQSKFDSMLPNDSQARRTAALESIHQTKVDTHFNISSSEEIKKLEPYSDALFKDAATQWLIETDQPIRAFEHPAFQEMIAVAARATKGVKVPARSATRKHIIDKFKEQMRELSGRLTGSTVSGEISITCDAWSASNADSYFAVTGHWIDEKAPQTWTLEHALLGFTQMNTAHNGTRLGQALFKICVRLRIVHKVGYITCDNASNNDTMLVEFARCLKENDGTIYDVKQRHIRCLAHIINLATQAVISTRSKAKYFNPHDDDAEILPDVDAERDEVGLIRMISVKARSSSQRKTLFANIQAEHNEKILQLLIDMKVRWSSTYVMLYRAESRMESINNFVYKLGFREKNLEKQKKLDAMELTDEEWKRVKLFCNILGHADKAQQAFSSVTGPTLFNALPAIESMYASWEKASAKPKYRMFVPALRAGMDKLDDYYQKTAASDAHIMAMLLNPEKKLSYFKKNWEADLVNDIIELCQDKIAERYKLLHATNGGLATLSAQAKPKNTRRVEVVRRVADTDSSDSDEETVDPSADPSKPWLKEYNQYMTTVESVPNEMGIVQWWGINHHRYPVFASLARDYLAVMASSVSSERAFSSAGITISKRRNRLKGDIVEALQCLKCMYHNKLIFRKVFSVAQEEEELDGMGFFEHEKGTADACEEARQFKWDDIIAGDDDDDDDDNIIVID